VRHAARETEASMTWQILGRLGASGLRDARLQAHWAVQVLAAAGETFLEPAPDTSHNAMSWDVKQGAFFGRVLSATRPCRVALRVADLTLLVLGADAAPFAVLALPGRTLGEADDFVAEQVQATTRAERARPLVHPRYELEPHPLARGGRFERAAGLPELARWYANAESVLRRLERETPSAGEVLCWPHDFDLATLITVEMDRSGEPVRTVGAGFSPGDRFVAQPYWYVSHAPSTERCKDLPALEAGEWFSEGWLGAVLRGEALVAAGGASEQQARLEAFFTSAISASRALALESPIGGT
jgi:hypothetical protein